jgi:hypothetical protein
LTAAEIVAALYDRLELLLPRRQLDREKANLTEAQKNAFYVLRSIRQIQRDYVYWKEPIFREEGGISFDPIGFKPDSGHDEKRRNKLNRNIRTMKYEELEKLVRKLLNKFGVQMILLTTAAINIDYQGLLSEHTLRGAKMAQGLNMAALNARKIP